VARIEYGFADDTPAALKAEGHHLIEPMGQTSANSIAVTPDGLLGAPDPRRRGSGAAGNQLVNTRKRACMPIDQ
jgi:gamma-glutamyltranspeptidase/glutathione hydrolase